MSTHSHNKTATFKAVTSLVAGIQKYLASTSFLVSGQSYTGTELVTILQPVATAIQATSSAKASYQTAVLTQMQTLDQVSTLLSSVRAAIYLMYATQVDKLAEFGLVQHKPHTITLAAKTQAVQKSLATRKARGTMGKNQKAKITGASAPVATSSGSEPAVSGSNGATQPAAPVTKQ